jgi:hypothetical protein
MTTSSPAPGWYPDPSGQGQRYFDGRDWTQHHASAQQLQPQNQAVVVTGPNHVLYAILTFLTWPLCGGWAWVWLFIAMNNKNHVTRY